MTYFEPEAALDGLATNLTDALSDSRLDTLGDLWDADPKTQTLVKWVTETADLVAQDQRRAVVYESNLDRATVRIEELARTLRSQADHDPKVVSELDGIATSLRNISHVGF
jgi:hypothetical protein